MKELSGIGGGPAAAIKAVDRNDLAALKNAAKGIESMFLYELIKTMRESAQSSDQGAFGSSTYMSMFDMELSRVLADRGIGLTDVLMRSLGQERTADASAKPEAGNGAHSAEARKNPDVTPNILEAFRKLPSGD